MRNPFMLIPRIVGSASRWEGICDRCGRCCFMRELDEDGDVVIDYAAPCDFLDTESRRCTVYPKRFKRCDRCRKLTLWHALFDPYLPQGCAYRRYFGRD